MTKLLIEGLDITEYDVYVGSGFIEYEETVCATLEIYVKRINPPTPRRRMKLFPIILFILAALALMALAVVH